MHRSVQSLARGLTLLRELSASGPSTVVKLAGRAGLHRTTCYRLLETLVRGGYVTFDKPNATYALTPLVRTLSDGATVRDLSSQAALPPMFKLLGKASWPSDFAVFDTGSLLIRESTHPYSPFSVHRSMVGRRRSLVRTSLGKAILTAARPALRREMLEMTKSQVREDAKFAEDRGYIKSVIAQTEADGYASSVGQSEDGISAIALPIRAGGPVIGALNLVFFTSSMTPSVAARRYLKDLSLAVEAIEKGWAATNRIPRSSKEMTRSMLK